MYSFLWEDVADHAAEAAHAPVQEGVAEPVTSDAAASGAEAGGVAAARGQPQCPQPQHRRNRSMLAGIRRKRQQEAETCIVKMTEVAMPTLAMNVSRLFAVGTKSRGVDSDATRVSRVLNDADRFVASNARRQNERNRDRGLASHVEKTAERLPIWLDDANMPCSRHARDEN